MSYDAGTIEDIEVASLFNKNNIIGTFNLNSEYLGTTRGWPMQNGDTIFQAYIPKDSLLTVYKKHEIAAHGAYHQNFIDITDVEVLKEIETDMRILKQLTGKALKSMAYPFGNTTEHIAKIVETTGIKNTRTVADTYTFKSTSKLFYLEPDLS